jgi:thioredoxin-dependent peroxiredoxin
MAQITLGGNPIHTNGDIPAVGAAAPAFSLTKVDLSETTLADYAGKNLVLNIFPSVDTPVCAQSVRTFNARAAEKADTVVLCVSADLPFAQGRFCGAEGLANVVTGSTFRNPSFLDAYGVRVTDSAFAGLAARAVVVINGSGTVVHSELVGEVAHEPNYDAALAAIG